MNVSLTFSLSYETVISECSLTVQNIQDSKCFLFLGYVNIKGTFSVIILQMLQECCF